METALNSGEKGVKGLSANAIKVIMALMMLADHCVYLFIPYDSPWHLAIRTLTRAVAPTFCFFIVEGFFHTRSKGEYALRLGIFSIISHFPYTLLFSGTVLPSPFHTSVFFTLFCGLMSIWVWEKLPSYPMKVLAMALFTLLGNFGDWYIYGVWMVWIFYFLRGRFRSQIVGLSVIAVLMFTQMSWPQLSAGVPFSEVFSGNFIFFGIPLAMVLIYFYNGTRGRGGKAMKWFFYVFYPLHLMALYGLLYLLFRMGY